MAEEMRQITVVFKTDSDRRGVEYYSINLQELERLARNFAGSQDSDGARLGVYDVLDQNDKPRKLMLRFADVLYIG